MGTADPTPRADHKGSAERVYLGIMHALETGRMVPGQRLAETDLAALYGVGRNAVREAIQHLAARGVVDLTRFRSPSIRRLDLVETMEILSVATVMTALVARTAAERFDAGAHRQRVNDALAQLTAANRDDEPGMFSKARRNFYRTLLQIGGNRELQRLFPAIGMHIIYAQYQSPRLRGVRLADYQKIMNAVKAGEGDRADRAGAEHVEHVRRIIAGLSP